MHWPFRVPYREACAQGQGTADAAIRFAHRELTVVVLYAINIWLRKRSPASVSPGLSAPVLLSIVGVALLFVSGWLGGQMVHVYGVGVEGRE
ncbi:DUF2231 domain-containing protein [Paraburkholderia sp. NMBU_R16]|uniref:DUF2231 domain-containing protein n=1 Tax=Paraburkholderia sp. NMBU_R16 TaxID=2698676 RepID=UPI001566E6D9|nr:DUF2231 domain-containing protein [Paraburkholderia sp. NMBU_R16]